MVRANSVGVNDLKPTSTQGTADYNFYEGKISYSYEFTNRPFTTVKNEYILSLKFDRDGGRSTASINGIVQGLLNNITDSYMVKYQNALNFWNSYSPTIYGLVNAFVGSGISLNPIPSARSRGDNQLQGSIQYDYEYDTSLPTSIPNALSQTLTQTDGGGTPVMALIGVPGRSSGPVIQDMGTVSVKARGIQLEVIMILGFPEPDTDSFVNGFAPAGSNVYVARDQKTWSPRTGRYARDIEWNYE